MMKDAITVFKSRRFAAAVCAVCAVAAIYISAAVSCSRAEKLFYNGVKYDGYVHTSVYDAVVQREHAVNGLLGISADISELSHESETLRTARHNLIDAENSGSISAMYSANSELEAAAEKFRAAVEVYVSEGGDLDSEAYDEYTGMLDSGALLIKTSGYNERISELCGGSGSLLNVLPFIEPPECFG